MTMVVHSKVNLKAQSFFSLLYTLRSSYDEETIAYDFPADTGPVTWSGTHRGFRLGTHHCGILVVELGPSAMILTSFPGSRGQGYHDIGA